MITDKHKFDNVNRMTNFQQISIEILQQKAVDFYIYTRLNITFALILVIFLMNLITEKHLLFSSGIITSIMKFWKIWKFKLCSNLRLCIFISRLFENLKFFHISAAKSSFNLSAKLICLFLKIFLFMRIWDMAYFSLIVLAYFFNGEIQRRLKHRPLLWSWKQRDF